MWTSAAPWAMARALARWKAPPARWAANSNPRMYTAADWAQRLDNDNAFATRVWQQPKIWLIGNEAQLHGPGA